MSKSVLPLITCISSLLITFFILSIAQVSAQQTRFIVRNGSIYDPAGKQFIVKGVTAAYGTFAGGDVANYGAYNYNNQYHTFVGDFNEIKRLGGNLIRIMASVPNSTYYNANYATYYTSEQNYKQELDKMVKLVRQAGLIAYIIPHHPNYNQDTINFLSYLASTYKDDPYIWIGTSNEPDTCVGTLCWQTWYSWHDKYVRAIRATGYQNPIIVNGIYWSGRIDQLLNYPLHDNLGNVDMNLIYGPHKYGNDVADFWTGSLSEVEQYRTGISDDPKNPYAIIIDEYGNYNGGKGQISWLKGFQEYVTEWVQGTSTHVVNGVTYQHSIGGDGVIAFTWRWSDGNKLVNWQGFGLTEWGSLFATQYLQKVNSVGPGSTPTPSPSPTPASKQGDANQDNFVNELDFSIWIKNYLSSLTGATNGDFNLDNYVDGVDYVIWLNNYGK